MEIICQKHCYKNIKKGRQPQKKRKQEALPNQAIPEEMVDKPGVKSSFPTCYFDFMTLIPDFTFLTHF